jgi:hypothetical protein
LQKLAKTRFSLSLSGTQIAKILLMKRLAVWSLLVLSANLLGQHRLGSVVMDLNSGFESYNSTNTYQLNNLDGLKDTVIDSHAGNTNASLGLEVGIGKFVGIGLRAKANFFTRTLDAVTNSRGDVFSNDLIAMVNLHPLPFKKFDLVLGAEMGLSKLKFDVNDLYQTMVTGKGGYFAVHVNPRFYFRRFGFNFRAALPVFNYNDLQRSSDRGNYILSKWKASGLGVSVGVQYRFF